MNRVLHYITNHIEEFSGAILAATWGFVQSMSGKMPLLSSLNIEFDIVQNMEAVIMAFITGAVGAVGAMFVKWVFKPKPKSKSNNASGKSDIRDTK